MTPPNRVIEAAYDLLTAADFLLSFKSPELDPRTQAAADLKRRAGTLVAPLGWTEHSLHAAWKEWVVRGPR